MTFGDILRNLLDDNDMTQKQFAAALNIAPSTLGSYVQNAREPDFDTLKRIADHFHITTDYLLDYHAAKTENYHEDELLRLFRSLSREQQEMYLEQGKVIERVNRKEWSSTSISHANDRSS